MYRFTSFLCFLLLTLNLFAASEQFSLTREDGSTLYGYLDVPENETSFPLVVFLDGSYETTVKVNHDSLSSRFLPEQIGVISLEKRGITQEGINKKEFYKYDCFEGRLKDYSLLLSFIKEKNIERHDGRCILLGGSEGGLIVPKLNTDFPDMTTGAVLVGSGGGLPFGEAMKYQSQQTINGLNVAQRFALKIRNAVMPNKMDAFFEKILKDPYSLVMSGPKTWKWWASYLRNPSLNELLKIETPIYLIHGKLDSMVPVESADLISSAFDKEGKTNLAYARYDDLGHALSGRDDVYDDLIGWIKDLELSDQELF